MDETLWLTIDNTELEMEKIEWVEEMNLLISYDGELFYKWMITISDKMPNYFKPKINQKDKRKNCKCCCFLM